MIMRPLSAAAIGLSCSIFFATVESKGQGAPRPPAQPTYPTQSPYLYSPQPQYQQPYPQPQYQQPYPQPQYQQPYPQPQYQQPYYPQPGAYGAAPAPAARLAYREGVAPPAGYHLEEHPRKGLVIAGAVVLGATYLLSASIGMASSNNADHWLVVPVFGPFLDLGARGNRTCSSSGGDVDCVVEPVIRIYLAMDGVVQVAGAVLLTTGFVFQKKELVSDTYYGLYTRGPRLASWSVVPEVIPGSRYVLTFRGRIF